MTIKRRSEYVCPVDVTLGVINGKWKPMILWLLAGGRQRFSEFQAAMPRVAPKVLSQQLRQLETDGVVRRTVRGTPAIRVEYELTDFGRTLRPALNALASWGKDHFVQWARRGQEVCNKLAGLPMPSACVIAGSCCDAGLELALACDYRVVVNKGSTALGVG